MNETMARKHLHAAIKQVDRSRREIKALLTHQVVDADGEVVVASGVDWSRWTFNAPMLYQHDHDQKVGNWEPGSLRLEVVGGAPGWTATGRLFSKGALADQVYGELQEGAMGVSIGFLTKRADFEPVASGQTGRTFHKVQIVEASLVNLQSCPTCVVLEKSGRLGGREDLVLALVDDGDSRLAVEPDVLRAALAEVVRDVGVAEPDAVLALADAADDPHATYCLAEPADLAPILGRVVAEHVGRELHTQLLALTGKVD